MPDHYTYPGTDVLVNRLGYTDPGLWKAAERRIIGLRLRDLLDLPPAGGFDLTHLQDIHRYLTQDLYTWGGQLRDTDTGPGGTAIAHCRPQFIPAEADRIFTALADVHHLRGRDADGFSEGLAWVWGEATALHPFRDVNTRSQFVFFTHLAAAAGWVIDWAAIDPAVFAHARTVAIAGDVAGIDALVRPALYPADPPPVGRVLPGRLRSAVDEHVARTGSKRTPTQLDRDLHAALERRHGLGAPDLATEEDRRDTDPPMPGR